MQEAAPNSFKQMRVETLAIMGVVVAAIVILFIVLSGRQAALRASNVGFDGLQVWLTANKMSAQSFTGGWQLEPDTIGLLVVPVFDSRFDQKRVAPKTKEEFLQQQDEYDLRFSPLSKKRSSVPTMVVLPKWRSGVRLADVAHPELLIENGRISDMLQRLLPDKQAALVPPTDAFTHIDYHGAEGQRLTATLYAAQLFASKYCNPVIGTQKAMILAECLFEAGKSDGVDATGKFLILSDPDLLNNHGLKLGDNAFIARHFLKSRVGDNRVVIDYSESNWIKSTANIPKRERSWEDLLRFFEPPLLFLWLSSAFLFVLLTWRGAVRFGPAKVVAFNDGSKQSTMIAAFSKIMRISGQDGAMASEYATARISAVASSLFGPAQARIMAREDNFVTYVRKRDSKLADRLSTALKKIHRLPSHASSEAAMKQIDELEQVLESIAHGS
ncbi:hypothetical protein [Cohaesibacter gelatinilyticus]|uniref:DUF4350 domain-containing protein n=1 Tax=Cohaesibacter gelatinilyticus TaxID=372072 RepID=A0A285NCF9_9HYPH|nr:hypothetical protein [Cohaesibacter gelatinilyticus]SNZ06617.1 hypothetical protein SAMN06265368_0481 [Cohaesibacter gelatinilyticus]